jgi:hypothetical protein
LNNCVSSSYRILGILDKRQAEELSRITENGIDLLNGIYILNSIYSGSDFRSVEIRLQRDGEDLSLTPRTLHIIERLNDIILKFLCGDKEIHEECEEDMTTGLIAGVLYSGGDGHSITLMKSKNKVRVIDNQANTNISLKTYLNQRNIKGFYFLVNASSPLFRKFQQHADYIWFQKNTPMTERITVPMRKGQMYMRSISLRNIPTDCNEFINMYIDYSIKYEELKMIYLSYLDIIREYRDYTPPLDDDENIPKIDETAYNAANK